MTTHDRELAERINGDDRSPWFVEYKSELYPLNGEGRTCLPDEVLSGDREADETEALSALRAQGYTLD